jgi:hypothetical protein
MDQEEPSIAVAGDGTVYVAWKDWQDDPDPQNAPYLNHIYTARSTDGAASFELSVRVTDEYMNAEYGYVFPPRLTVDGSGAVHVVWHDTRTGIAACYYDRSLDGGISFGNDVMTHEVPTVSHLLPRIAVGADYRVFVTWMDSRNGNGLFDVFYSSTTVVGK